MRHLAFLKSTLLDSGHLNPARLDSAPRRSRLVESTRLSSARLRSPEPPFLQNMADRISGDSPSCELSGLREHEDESADKSEDPEYRENVFAFPRDADPLEENR